MKEILPIHFVLALLPCVLPQLARPFGTHSVGSPSNGISVRWRQSNKIPASKSVSPSLPSSNQRTRTEEEEAGLSQSLFRRHGVKERAKRAAASAAAAAAGRGEEGTSRGEGRGRSLLANVAHTNEHLMSAAQAQPSRLSKRPQARERERDFGGDTLFSSDRNMRSLKKKKGLTQEKREGKRARGERERGGGVEKCKLFSPLSV